MKTWRLRREAEKRFFSGHPWVYSNELMESPKGIQPGDEILLRDAGGERILARGYGNASSLIAFRALTHAPAEAESALGELLLSRLRAAWDLRLAHGLGDASFRWVYAENDGLPGLVIDRYLLEGGAQAVVLQPQTAGAERWVGALEKLVPEVAGKGSLVIRGDAGARALEGIPEREARVAEGDAGALSSSWIQVRAATPGRPNALFPADLVAGQKTGFFLDQTANAAAVARIFLSRAGRKRARILDLFAHAGQWGVLLGAAARQAGCEVEVVAMDASEKALSLAKAALDRAELSGKTIRADLLEPFADPAGGAFDLVVCDPPALISSKKHLAAGTRAYRKMYARAWSLVAPGGAMVASSCSYHLDRGLFREALARAVGDGGHAYFEVKGASWDHPGTLTFPEADYLKTAWVERR